MMKNKTPILDTKQKNSHFSHHHNKTKSHLTKPSLFSSLHITQYKKSKTMSFKPKKLISHSRAADAVVILPLKGETIRARLSLTTTTNTPEMPILDDSAHDKTHQQGRRPRRGWVSKFLVALNEMTALPYSFDMNQAAEVAASSPGCIVMFEEEETVDKTITAKYSATVKQNSMAHQNSSDSNTTSNSDTNSPTSTAPKAETATTSPKLTNLTLPTLPTFPDNFAVSLSLALERVLRDGDYQSVQSMTLMPQQPCHGPCGLDSVAHVGEDDENDDDYESDEVNDCEDGEDYDDEDYEEDEDEDEKRGIDNDDDEYDETSSIESSSDKSSAFVRLHLLFFPLQNHKN
jgi:hypothetical protein